MSDGEAKDRVAELKLSAEGVLQQLPGGIALVAAPSGRILFLNDWGRALLGSTFYLAPGAPEYAQYEAFHSDGRAYQPEEWPAIRALTTGEVVAGEEIVLARTDGTLATLHVNAAPLRNATGQIVGSGVVFHDVSEDRRREEELRVNAERHQAIAEITTDYAYIARIERSGTVVVEWATEGFTHVTGYTTEELEARGGWVALIHPDDLPGLFDRMEHRLLQAEADDGEARIVTRSGEVRWIHYSTRPVFDPVERRVVRFYGAVSDITDRKRYEERLRALTEQLLAVQEQERRRVARELHDEVGQLLTGLNFTLEACGRCASTDLPACLAEAQALVRELAGRVRDLSLRLRPTMLDDLGLVPALVWLFDRYRAQASVQVDFQHRGADRRFPPDVETAAYRLVQEALTNVARHAGTREAVVRLWADAAALGVQVEDHGRGFDPAAVSGPSGGLSGMYERVRLLGGRLEVAATPGRGTRLTAELPLASPREGGSWR